MRAKHFEVSDIIDLADQYDALESTVRRAHLKQWGFLPFPVCWLEARGDGGRAGILLIARDEDDPNSVRNSAYVMWDDGISLRIGGRRMFHHGYIYPESSDEDFDAERALNAIVGAALIYINRPQNVGLVLHQPHAGLARRIARAQPMVGKFPLMAWTEVRLTGVTRDHLGRRVEGRLSNRKPLHWVKAHLRPSTGALVKAHTRGDPALGIKQSRYVCQPGARDNG